jgi:hypothetical protein
MATWLQGGLRPSQDGQTARQTYGKLIYKVGYLKEGRGGFIFYKYNSIELL